MNVKEELFIDENGVVSLQINEDIDIDLATRYYIETSNNLKLEVKYPNLEKIDSQFLKGNNYIKQVYLKTKPKKVKNTTNLCQNFLGIYPNVAFDPIKKCNKIIIQGFVPHKKLSYQDHLRIGDLILFINDMEVSYENIEAILSSILKENQDIMITALGPITYKNLDTHGLIIQNYFPDLIGINQNTMTKAPSKSISVVKGDRVKAVNDSFTSDDLFFFAMILSLDKNVLKRKPESKEKNDLIYTYPRNDSEYAFRKLNNTILCQLVEVIRGLFMTLSFAIKDIDQNDRAICSTIDYQGMVLNVGFLHKNFGNKGIMIIIVPRDQVDMEYFKILAKNLNESYKFTFGSKTLDTLIDPNEDVENKDFFCSELDVFFNQFHLRLIQSSLFRTFNKDAKNLSYFEKVWCYNEMKTKIFDTIPFFELPIGLKIDLETILSDLESQESIDIGRNDSGYRRLFHVYGSCLFFQNNLLVSHLNESVTKLVFNFCDHYDYFNQAKNHFRIWREIEIESLGKKCRHFLIAIGLKDFIGVMIIQSGGLIAKEIDRYKTVEPNDFYIQKVLYMLLDLDNSGMMMEVNQTLSSKTSKIFFNIDKFVVSKKKRQLLKEKKRTLSQSPLRIKNERSRSLSQTKNQVDFAQRTGISVTNSNDENSCDEIESINEKIYQTKSLSRHNSISDIGRMSFKGGNLVNIEDESKVFNDLSLINSVIYYASSDNGMNGVLFTPRHFDINSSLFQRFFYKYIECCLKIKSLFEDQTQLEFGTNLCHYLIEQGVLFDFEIENQKQRSKNKNGKVMNFWVVGRRRLQRTDPQSKWIVVGDCFVCLADNLESFVLELAFDMGYSKMNF